MINFADVNKAKEIIESLYPNAKSVRIIEYGYDNIVGLIDHKYTLRFPRNKSAYIRNQYELHVLKDLENLNIVSIPRVLELGENPPFVITSYVSGEHISSDDIKVFPVEKQKKFGEDVASFAYKMHILLSIDKTKEYREQYDLDSLAEEPWDLYFMKSLTKQRFMTKTQKDLAIEYYEEWIKLKYFTPKVVVHDDLHTNNLLFSNGNLVGVIDFGDTNIGNPEQEFRQLYRINELILQSALETYEKLSGYPLNTTASKIWAICQELAAYSEMITEKKFDYPAYKRSVNNLMKWFPEGNWDTLLKY
jgi:aminoglycoside 2''-phosphotransferase